ncbi:MAG: methylmalonyl Co-A mutase-associated GTPase MeaB [Alicyclobacillus sp.]|nr:methylmalonyl Co-A mutase-associated GTPase MeaB [Alicyclobacillus sp.]
MHPLAAAVLQGDARALARALSVLENGGPEQHELCATFAAYLETAWVTGWTGAPGAGKSTLVDQVVTHVRQQGERVGVLAVDPSSPWSGGALLGDRVRMARHSTDPGVFIRSVSSRGERGGLAAAVHAQLGALAAFGCRSLLVETVGAGQAEVDVMRVADTVVVVVTPGAGDLIQAAKSGLMEVADVFVVNKADQPGALAVAREVRWVLERRLTPRSDWQPPVLLVSAARGEGVEPLLQALAHHRQYLTASGCGQQRRRLRFQTEVLRGVEAAVRTYLRQRAASDPQWREVLESGTVSNPWLAVERLLQDLPWLRPSS